LRPPTGSDWPHEIKYDGYRMHARLDISDGQRLRHRERRQGASDAGFCSEQIEGPDGDGGLDKEDPNAVRRDWKSADGKTSGTKYERIVTSLIGYIEDIQFFDGTYGMEINVAFDRSEDGYKPVMALKLSSREGEDFLKKLPNLDLTKEVRVRPYNFTGRDDEEVRGIEVTQQDPSGEFNVKIVNYFYDPEQKVETNGFLSPEGDTSFYSKDDWKIYFMLTRKFLKTYTEKEMCPKIGQAVIDRGAGVVEKQTHDPSAGEAHPDEIPV
jgi:hypothetical protein